MDEFFVRAALAGIGVAVVAGPLGCFVVWRRMAYFEATLAHAALLGIALGLILDINLRVGILMIACLVSALLVLLQSRPGLATDTLLGILAHGTLAVGLLVLSFAESLPFNLMGYLFGDILAVSVRDLYWIFAAGTICLAWLTKIWHPLLLATVDEELARAEGVPIQRLKLSLMILLSISIAVTMQLVGVLLIASLLIIPAATARQFAGTPERMAVLAAIVGGVAVVAGLVTSLGWDTPAGPTIVTAAAVLFGLSLLLTLRRARTPVR